MHRTALSVLSAIGLAVAPLAPMAAWAEPEATGTIAIPLTDTGGGLTDTAVEGFDVAGTTSPIATAASSFASAMTQARIPDMRLAAAGSINASAVEEDLQEDYALLTKPIAIGSPFAVVGVTWNKDEALPAGSGIEVRTLDAGQWSNWFALDVVEAPEGVEAARNGTEYSVSGASTGIQVRITRGEGPLPSDLEVDVVFSEGDTQLLTDAAPAEHLPSAQSLQEPAVDEEPASEDSVPEGFVDDAAAAQEAPEAEAATAHLASATLAATDTSSLVNANANIRSRDTWLGSAAAPSWGPSYAPFEGVIIHHTAGSNTYTQEQVPAIIRAIYTYHAFTNGWGDIGYNVLVDKFGGRWEGRYGTLASSSTQMVVGGHASPRNTGTMGVSVLATYYPTGDPNGNHLDLSETVLTALEEVTAWKFIVSGINPDSPSPLTIPAQTSTYTSDIGAPLPRIVGHKDVSATACPGYLYESLPRIRAKVKQLYDTRASSAADEIMAIADSTENTDKTAMFRLYNRISHEHLYTASVNEAITLSWEDWNYEGVGWIAPEESESPVYRLYNPILHDHHYTLDENEVDTLVSRHGWNYEGIGWHSATGESSVPTYRQFNPGLQVGSHNFTTDINEYDINNSAHGWKGEGVAWQALEEGWPAGTGMVVQ